MADEKKKKDKKVTEEEYQAKRVADRCKAK